MRQTARSLPLLAALVVLASLLATAPVAGLPSARPLAHDGYLLNVDGTPVGIDRRVEIQRGAAPMAARQLLVDLDPAHRERLLRAHGLRPVTRIPSLRVEVVEVHADPLADPLVDPLALARILRREVGVRLAEPDYLAEVAHDDHDKRPRLRSKDPIHYAQRALRQMGIRRAWARSTGDQTVKIAIVDTGIDPDHEDLNARFAEGIDLVNDDEIPEDNLGHGTAIAGVIGAPGDNEKGIAGVCWKAQLMAVKVADDRGVAKISNLARGIVWAAERGARVINVSLGTFAHSEVLHRACQTATQAGALIVAPAGNDNVHCVAAPACYPEVLAVASSGGEKTLGLVTNLGPEIEVAASGENIVTTMPGSLYTSLSGTSLAAAHVSGVAALLLSKRPALKASQLRAIIRRSVNPIPALVRQGAYDFGALDAELALQAALDDTPDAAVRGLRTLPARPRVGQPFQVVLQLENRGNGPYPATTLSVLSGSTRATADVRPMALGERREVAITLTAPADPTTLVATLAPVAAEAAPRRADNTRTRKITPVPGDTVDLAITRARIADLDVGARTMTLKVRVENRGSRDATATLTACGCARGKTGAELARRSAPVAVGKSVTLDLPVTVGNLSALQIDALAVGDETPKNNSAQLVVPRARKAGEGARLYYQQSGSVDLIADAPFRAQTDRPYVPVLLFVPDNGGVGEDRYLSLTRVSVGVRSTVDGAATPVYEDTPDGPPSVAYDGLTMVDEMGTPTDSLDLFGDSLLYQRGRHVILRVPLAAFGVDADTEDVHTRYIEVNFEWRQKRKIFFFFDNVRTGSHRRVLKTRLTPHGFPRMPGLDQHYYDAHFHTIAEWFTADPYRIFAPRKAWGGPIVMIAEAAYAMGLTESPNDFKNKVITTDHNVFYYNEKTPGESTDDHDYRPPFGPTSAGASAESGTIVSEWERYRQLFGLAAGQEVTFSQNQALIVPLGAHLLTYRAQHFDGSWHGGSTFSKIIGEGGKLELDTVLRTLAQDNYAENRHAFSYAAHPRSSQGWSDDNLARALGLEPKYRTKRYVNPETKQFVFKGFQVWNGAEHHRRGLPSSEIDFHDLDPWRSADWNKGNANFDQALWVTMNTWHRAMAETMRWEFHEEPGVVLVRKVFGEAGTDAHGDFNFSTGRAAALLKFKFTYSVGSCAWAEIRTLAFPEGQPGATRAERLMSAMAHGASVMTDGPVVTFSIDADSRFDSRTGVYHARRELAENTDGQMGGAGAYDGGRTALVVAGSPDVVFRYRYVDWAELGERGKVTGIKIYRSRVGDPNPTRKVKIPGALFFQKKHYDRPVGVGSLPTAGPGLELSEAIDPDEEGLVHKLTAFTLGAYTGTDPDLGDLHVDDTRCLTNPIYTAPVQIAVQGQPDADGVIAPYQLKVELRFPMSMSGGSSGKAPRIGVKALGADGASTGYDDAPITWLRLVSWSGHAGAKNAKLRLVNDEPLELAGLARYPDNGKVTLLVYFADAPRDYSGNALNRIAFPVEIELPEGLPAPAATTDGDGSGSEDGAGSTAATTGGGSSSTTTPRNDSTAGSGSSGSSGTSGTSGAGGTSSTGGVIPGGTTGLGGAPRDDDATTNGNTGDGGAIQTPHPPVPSTRENYRKPVPVRRAPGERKEWRPEKLDDARDWTPRGGRRAPRWTAGKPGAGSSRPVRTGRRAPSVGQTDRPTARALAVGSGDPLAPFGCFVATAALESGRGEPADRVVRNHTGTYHLSADRARQLDQLRALRDRVLMPWPAGQRLVARYYRDAPALARAIRPHPALRAATRVVVVAPAAWFARIATGERDGWPAIAVLLAAWAIVRRRRRVAA